MVRPNIGTVAGGAWVWDDTAWLPWDVLYSANYSALQLPPDTDLRDVDAADGRARSASSSRRSAYDLGYDDGDRLRAAPALRRRDAARAAHRRRLDVRLGPPLRPVRARHRRTSTCTASAIDDRLPRRCATARGARAPSTGPRQAAYVTGAADADHGFLAVTNTDADGDDPIAYGFLRRDGRDRRPGRRRADRRARRRAGLGRAGRDRRPPTPTGRRAARRRRAGQPDDHQPPHVHRHQQPRPLGPRRRRGAGARTRTCGRCTRSPPASGRPTSGGAHDRRAARLRRPAARCPASTCATRGTCSAATTCSARSTSSRRSGSPRAAASVTTGELIPLDLPLDVPDPPLFGRRPYEHHVVALNRHEMRRPPRRLPPAGLHAVGRARATCAAASTASGAAARRTRPTGPNGLGIDHWARHGIAGRGVLIDVAGWLRRTRPGVRPARRRWPSPPTTSRRRSPPQGVEPEVGDIWCVRTGWVEGVPRGSTAAARAAYAEAPHFAGLRADEAMARFVWNAHPAALCCDNPAVEVVPGDPGRRVAAPPPAADARHRARRDVRPRASSPRPAGPTAAATFFFVAAPLHLPGRPRLARQRRRHPLTPRGDST